MKEETVVKTEVEKEKECDCADLRLQLEEKTIELEKAYKTIKEYQDAYQELQNKFYKLYGILSNQIDYTINLK